MSTVTNKIEELDEKFKITIYNSLDSVSAPLHDDFGFTVGSEYTTPFDTGSMSGLLQKSFAIAGVSAPVGLRMRKMYANPEPTELSFKMSFNAYYDAHIEVASPVLKLVTMGLGREMTDADVKEKMDKFEAALGEITKPPTRSASVSPTVPPPETPSGLSGKMYGLIKMVNAPKTCTLKFGKFITFEDVYITSTAVTFSNQLDSRGIPMSAEVNVTCTLQIAPIADDILRFFGRDG